MYSEADFIKCAINPCKKNLFEYYPRLMTIKSINEKLVRYIIATYDYNSPIVREIRDLRLRKQAAATFAGYDLGTDSKYLDSIFDLTDPVATVAIDTYVKEFLYNRLWARICGDEQHYWQCFKRMMKPINDGGESGKDKDTLDAFNKMAGLGATMQEIDLRLDSAYKRLYGDEDYTKFLSKRALPEDMSQKA